MGQWVNGVNGLSPRWSRWVFAALVLAAFFVVLHLPLLTIYVPLLAQPRHIAEPFLALFHDPQQRAALLNSLLLAVGAAGLSLLIAVPISLCLTRLNVPFKPILAPAALIPLTIPPFLTAVVWIELLGQAGLLNQLLESFTHHVPPLTIYSRPGVIWVLSLCYFPCIVWVTAGALCNVDAALEDDARTCASEWTVLWRVTLPLVAPSVLLGALFVFLLSLAEFGVPSLLLINRTALTNQTYQVGIYSDFSLRYDAAEAARNSLPLLGCMVIPFGLMWASWRGKSLQNLNASLRQWGNGAMSRRPNKFIDSLPHLLLSALCLFVVLVADVVPLVSLFFHSLPLSRYAKVWGSHTTEIINTALLPLAAAVCGVALAFAGAVVVERVLFRWQNVLTLFALLPVAVPPVLVGVALIALYNRPSFEAIYGTKAMVVLGYLARFLPFAFVAVRGAVQSLDVGWEEAAQVEGATWWQSIWHVTRPLTAPALRGAGLLVFVLSAGELSVTLLVNPPGGQTIPFTIDNFMHYGHTPEVATLGMILATMTVGAALAWRGRPVTSILG